MKQNETKKNKMKKKKFRPQVSFSCAKHSSPVQSTVGKNCDFLAFFHQNITERHCLCLRHNTTSWGLFSGHRLIRFE